ncbi:MAG: hypothetical protein ACYTE3_17495 [Planctomycetota bacterium]
MLLCGCDWRKCRVAELGDEGHPGCTYLTEVSLNVVVGGVSSVRKTIKLTSIIDEVSQSNGPPGASEGMWDGTCRITLQDQPGTRGVTTPDSGEMQVRQCNNCYGSKVSRTTGRAVTYNLMV